MLGHLEICPYNLGRALASVSEIVFGFFWHQEAIKFGHPGYWLIIFDSLSGCRACLHVLAT